MTFKKSKQSFKKEAVNSVEQPKSIVVDNLPEVIEQTKPILTPKEDVVVQKMKTKDVELVAPVKKVYASNSEWMESLKKDS